MKNIKLILAIALFTFTSTLSMAQIAPVDDNGLAIGGYDVVAYFSGTAQEGSTTITTKHEGATYQFVSKENLEAFKEAPNKYLPQFDGFCAFGLGAQGAKYPIDPKTFDIIDGKLYLFYNGPFEGKTFNTLQPWSLETTKLKDAAHANWSKPAKATDEQ